MVTWGFPHDFRNQPLTFSHDWISGLGGRLQNRWLDLFMSLWLPPSLQVCTDLLRSHFKIAPPTSGAPGASPLATAWPCHN